VPMHLELTQKVPRLKSCMLHNPCAISQTTHFVQDSRLHTSLYIPVEDTGRILMKSTKFTQKQPKVGMSTKHSSRLARGSIQENKDKEDLYDLKLPRPVATGCMQVKFATMEPSSVISSNKQGQTNFFLMQVSKVLTHCCCQTPTECCWRKD